MKIDEACIDHNAVRLIENITADAYEYCSLKEVGSMSERENQSFALVTLGNVCGVLVMARALKEVLKV